MAKRKNRLLDGGMFDSAKMALSMNLSRRGACAFVVLSSAVVLVGCGGGGGSGVPSPTRTAPPIPGATPVGSQPVTANQFVFVSNRTGATELFKADLVKANFDGSNAVQLTQLAKAGITSIERPSVSPDGRRIVFQYGIVSGSPGATATDNLEIALVNTDGSGTPIKLTQDSTPLGRPDDFNPVFSADNRYIYWTSKRGSGNATQVPHIWRMSGVVGQEANDQAQFIAEPSSFPSLDRTGNTLAYITPAQTSDPVAIQPLSNNTLTGTVTRIGGAINGARAFHLALSPDGSRVAFSNLFNSTANGSSGVTDSLSSKLNLFSVPSGASLGTAPSGGTSDADAAWSRDSQTLFFDSAGGTTLGRQIFSSRFPFTTKTQLTTGPDTTLNYASAFLPGG